jgi:hypothetical protein
MEHIVACVACGARGYTAKILEPHFSESLKGRVVKEHLTACFTLIRLNDSGVCEVCAQMVRST